MIGAVAEFNFKGSELEGLPLAKKIEFIFHEILSSTEGGQSSNYESSDSLTTINSE